MVDLDQARQDCMALQDSCRTLMLSSITPKGLPEISYAPFVTDGAGAFYIYVSELAAHTHNLLTTPQAAWMLITDEQDSPQLMARERITFHGEVTEIERSSPCWQEQLDQLGARCGHVMQIVRALPDFHLLKLQARDALYVKGFGHAFKLSGDRLERIEHVQGR